MKIDLRLSSEYATAHVGWVEVLVLHSDRKPRKNECEVLHSERKPQKYLASGDAFWKQSQTIATTYSQRVYVELVHKRWLFVTRLLN